MKPKYAEAAIVGLTLAAFAASIAYADTLAGVSFDRQILAAVALKWLSVALSLSLFLGARRRGLALALSALAALALATPSPDAWIMDGNFWGLHFGAALLSLLPLAAALTAPRLAWAGWHFAYLAADHPPVALAYALLAAALYRHAWMGERKLLRVMELAESLEAVAAEDARRYRGALRALADASHALALSASHVQSAATWTRWFAVEAAASRSAIEAHAAASRAADLAGKDCDSAVVILWDARDRLIREAERLRETPAARRAA